MQFFGLPFKILYKEKSYIRISFQMTCKKTDIFLSPSQHASLDSLIFPPCTAKEPVPNAVFN